MKAGYHPTHEKAGKKAAGKNSLKEQGFYHTPAWRKLRLLALQRDHYLCQSCLRGKKITKATEVHHLLPIADHPSLALDLGNLESLCWDCHEDTKEYPKATAIAPPGVRIIKVVDGSGEY